MTRRRLEDCCVTCLGCGHVYCRDTDISPGEADGICPTCWEQEDPEAVA